MSDVEKLQELIDVKFEGKQAAFARAIARAPTQITSYLKGRREIGVAFKAHVEQALDIPGWFGVMSRPSPELHVIPQTGDGHTAHGLQNVTPIAPRKKVPVISWVAAGAWSEVEDMYLPGEAERWADVYESDPSGNAFALVVEGDSMKSPYPDGLTFLPGTIIVVDPNRSASAGDFVVAKDVMTQKATFKKLVYDAGRWFLKPLNPAYPTIEIDDPAIRVIGRVIEYRNGGKL
jgi:SOS-response transcriptional repressor LexA